VRGATRFGSSSGEYVVCVPPVSIVRAGALHAWTRSSVVQRKLEQNRITETHAKIRAINSRNTNVLGRETHVCACVRRNSSEEHKFSSLSDPTLGFDSAPATVGSEVAPSLKNDLYLKVKIEPSRFRIEHLEVVPRGGRLIKHP